MRAAASNATQNPRNGPKENAKKMRSPRADAARPRNTRVQLPTIQSQLSGVSSQRIGWPVVPLVWQKRV